MNRSPQERFLTTWFLRGQSSWVRTDINVLDTIVHSDSPLFRLDCTRGSPAIKIAPEAIYTSYFIMFLSNKKNRPDIVESLPPAPKGGLRLWDMEGSKSLEGRGLSLWGKYGALGIWRR